MKNNPLFIVRIDFRGEHQDGSKNEHASFDCSTHEKPNPEKVGVSSISMISIVENSTKPNN